MYYALTTYNRLNILTLSLESLVQCEFPPDSHLIVSDDCSSPDVQKFIKDTFSKPIKNLDVKLIFNKINVGCDRNMVRVIRECFLKSNDKFVISIDSDAIYNPRWIHKLLSAKEQIKENIGMLGVFNTTNHSVVGDYNEDILIKESLGGFAVLLNKDVFLHPSLNFQSWDWSYVMLCGRLKYRIFCTKKSYAEHIGVIGTHSEHGGGDQATNFIAQGD